MFDRVSIDKLYKYQRNLLFLVVLLFPIQTVLFYKGSWAATFSFSGQISSLPLTIGFLIAVFSCFRLKKIELLYWFIGFLLVYFFIYAAISLHSIFLFCEDGIFDITTFGETSKLNILKKILVSIGISDSSVLYGVTIFFRDMLSSMRRIVFAFGFLVWIAFLYRNNASETFCVIRTAVLWCIVLLTPYVALEVFHLYGIEGATDVLKRINSVLYAPGYFMEGSSYPPNVSPNQVRGTWTEPAFFAFWLVFATPFLISFILEKGLISTRRILCSFMFFVVFWSVWWLTYSRTSVLLVLTLMSLYFFFTVVFHKLNDLKVFGFLTVTLLLSFFIVSIWGPAEYQKHQQLLNDKPASSLLSRVEKQVAESELMTNSLLSSFDVRSRSNPTRIQQFLLEIEAFKDHPIMGYGLTLSSYGLKKKMVENKAFLTNEWRERLALTERNGYFKSGIGSSSLSVSGSLASGGILGFSLIFLPLMILGLIFFKKTLRESENISDRKVCVFISAIGGGLAAVSQDLGFFYFWASAGLALGMVWQSNTINVLKNAK